MSRNSKDGYRIPGWTVEPEDPIRLRCTLLSVRLKNLLAVWTCNAGELVCLQAIVPWVSRQEKDSLLDCFVPFLERCVRFQAVELGLGTLGPVKLEQMNLYRSFRSILDTFPSAASFRPARTASRASVFLYNQASEAGMLT